MDDETYFEEIPLILAWALSIHKAQGQSFDLVKVDLARVFEPGHGTYLMRSVDSTKKQCDIFVAYTALSRATSACGLQVLHFRPDR